MVMMCYAFPPLLSPGALRSVAFARHLRELGWDVTILTARNAKSPWVKRLEPNTEGFLIVHTLEWSLERVVEVLNGVLSRLLRMVGYDLKFNYFRDVLCIPDCQMAWFTTWPGAKRCRGADVLYATCAPFSSAVSASIIKRLTRVPVVVDFRDAWSLNPHMRHTRLHNAILARLERAVVRTVDRVILNTPGATGLYRQKYAEAASKFECIPNGYDQLTPARRDVRVDSAGERDFTIVHVGTFYGRRQPDQLLDALVSIGDPRVRFVQVGKMDRSRLPKYDQAVRLEIIPEVPHSRALEIMQSASLLYLKQAHEPGVDHYIAVAAKTYEYLATGLPILADCPPGDNADLVARYASVPYVVTSGAAHDLAKAVRTALAADVKVTLSAEFVETYSRATLARRLSDVLAEVCRSR